MNFFVKKKLKIKEHEAEQHKGDNDITFNSWPKH